MENTSKIIADTFAKLSDVEAVCIAGSAATGTSDSKSDLDLYVYLHKPIPLPIRSEIARSRSDSLELGNDFWEPGDAWFERENGLLVEITYRTTDWIEREIDRVLQEHKASVGYSTCLWHSVLHSAPLFDRSDWYRNLQKRAHCDYPEALRRAVVEKNYPILRRLSSSYLHQIELAVERNDLVSINHRVAALLASYFDILFAVNRLPHPGEKRQIQFLVEHGSLIPNHMKEQVVSILRLSPTEVISDITLLLDGLDTLLYQEQLIA